MNKCRDAIAEQIGNRIRQFRTEQNLSQEELAFYSELYPAHVGKIERGEKSPNLETLYKISNGLKVPLHKLLDLSADTEATQTEAYFRIQNALDGLTAEQTVKVAQIVEQITELMKHSV